MERVEPVLAAEEPDLVIVPGDVNSTLATTLVAVKLGVPLAHVESGLRSFDRTMPEEVNRIVADEFADYLFAHSREAFENLRAEGVADERVFVVGNTMIDTLVAIEERFRSAGAARRFGLPEGRYLLVTLHRPALGGRSAVARGGSEARRAERRASGAVPRHPRTRKMIDGTAVAPSVRLIDPIGSSDFLSLEADAAAVLTDSGGVQEETTFLGVPCLTHPDNTEPPVTVRQGPNRLLGLDPAGIDEILPTLAEQPREPAGWPDLWARSIVHPGSRM
jgi:UDP-N-acetylglucosamine 2-epimerase (non-hydrolysing)